MERIPDEVLDRPVAGRNLSGATLREVLAGGPKVVALLRHLGWIFCRELVHDLRRARDAEPASWPPVVLLSLGLE